MAWDGAGYLNCSNAINIAEAQAGLGGPEARLNQDALYGIKRELLDQIGPSVVSINGTRFSRE